MMLVEYIRYHRGYISNIICLFHSLAHSCIHSSLTFILTWVQTFCDGCRIHQVTIILGHMLVLLTCSFTHSFLTHIYTYTSADILRWLSHPPGTQHTEHKSRACWTPSTSDVSSCASWNKQKPRLTLLKSNANMAVDGSKRSSTRSPGADQVRGDGGSRVGEVRAGTTSPMPEHKGFKLQYKCWANI